MTHEQLTVAQAEAFTILRDLMHMKADDPRPQRIINTIKQAAIAILRLKPLSREGEDKQVRQHLSGEGVRPEHTGAPSQPSETARSRETKPDPDLVASLPDPQFEALIAHLPHNTLHPRNEKQRLRLERHFAAFGLHCTDEIKAAIVNRASRRSSRSDTAQQAPPHAAPRRAA